MSSYKIKLKIFDSHIVGTYEPEWLLNCIENQTVAKESPTKYIVRSPYGTDILSTGDLIVLTDRNEPVGIPQELVEMCYDIDYWTE